MAKLRRRLFAALALLALGCAASLQANAATITFFSSRAAFNAAATNLQTITFEGIAPPNSVSPQFPSLTLLGVTFTSPGGTVSVVDSGFFTPLFDFGSGASLSGGPTITATLPGGITALGSDVMTTVPFGNPVQIVLSTGESFVISTLFPPARAFAGFTSDVPIASINFTRQGQGLGPLLDNFTFGQSAQVAAVPEPATILLLCTGLAGVAVRAHGRRRR